MIKKNLNIYHNIPISFNNIGMFKALYFLGFEFVKAENNYFAIYQHKTFGRLIVFNEEETETYHCLSKSGKPLLIYDLFSQFSSQVVMNSNSFQQSVDDYLKGSSYDYKSNPTLEPIKLNKLLNVLYKARKPNEKHPIGKSKHAMFIELPNKIIVPALKTNKSPHIIYFQNDFSIGTYFNVPYRFMHGNHLLNRYLVCSSIKDLNLYEDQYKENYQLLIISADENVKDLPLDEVLFPIYVQLDNQNTISEYYFHKMCSLFAIVKSFEPTFHFEIIQSGQEIKFLFGLSKEHSRVFRTTLAKKIKELNKLVAEHFHSEIKPSEVDVSNQITYQASKMLLTYDNRLESLLIVSESLIQTLDLKIISIYKY